MQVFKQGDKVASVGFLRSDGDFEVLATFNNNSEFMSDEDFFNIVETSKFHFNTAGEVDDVIALCREDAIDVAILTEEVAE